MGYNTTNDDSKLGNNHLENSGMFDRINGHQCGCGVQPSNSVSNRIKGGYQIYHGPFQVQLYLSFDGYAGICGGTVLNKKYVLTAAHCVKNIEGKLVSKVMAKFGEKSDGWVYGFDQ